MAHLPSNADMDIKDNIRERPTFSSKATFRSISVSSIALSCAYHLRMECNNDLPDKMEVNTINSSHLLYSNDIERGGNPVSKATDPDSTKDLQCVLHNTPAFNKAPKPQDKSAPINNTNTSPLQKDVINIQLLYDLNRPTEADLLDGNFHTISLYSLLEHLFSDTKYIKESLIYIAKYIDNKSIDINKSNNVANLRDMNEATWKLIFSIYNSGWDLLLADKNNNSFRQKVASKFTPKTNPIKTGKKRV